MCEREMNRNSSGKKGNTMDIIQEVYNGQLRLGPRD